MKQSPEGISILNKLQVTTKEVISYLESMNGMNDQVLSVLQKKPSLPGYEKLPWVIESKADKVLTSRLKNKKSLTSLQSERLREILLAALGLLQKGHRYEVKQKRTQGLQKYIKDLG